MSTGKSLAWTAPTVAAAAAIGSVATKETKSRWYRSLDKPPFQPPAPVFPIAWTALYASTALAGDRDHAGAGLAGQEEVAAGVAQVFEGELKIGVGGLVGRHGWNMPDRRGNFNTELLFMQAEAVDRKRGDMRSIRPSS